MIQEKEIISNNPFLYYFEYIEDGKIIGYVKYLVMYDKMEIENIFVEEQYRGKGIGTKLMSYLISKAIEKQVVNITLEVRISNEIARNLYKKFGFREVALRKFYYGDEDGILMEKQVM